ncbi:MAG: tRNA uridine-5-carboxymethylaminomethyl(34) synthesis GTPase MnmE [Bacteroidota bacterium]|nr:tRNA uridine-5-carboxymethylaminomethyl(34) synthesis GTPase MnmE [Bacteroidota bacterium]
MNRNDTICALSTPPGMGAIAVIRISGPEAIPACEKIFRPAEKNLKLSDAPSHTLHFGTISTSNELLDEVLVSVFKAPHSYTGEDVIEISCHGSVYIQQKIIEVLICNGLRMAQPGEFTMRAFLNGRFDLSQAEAIADLIASQSQSAHDLAIRQMRGGFSKKIRELREKLVTFASLVELELDFSEEDVEFADRSKLLDLILQLKNEIANLLNSFTIGNVIKKGIPVTIIGKPNVGKSTLLNALLNEERAIVSEIPGTTRDTVEDTIVIGGYSFRFIDTAGLREAEGKIESIGIEKTWEKIHQATIILYVFDATKDSSKVVMNAVSEFSEITEDSTKRLILIGNKTDKLSELPKGFREFVDHETIFISAKRKENIHLIAESLLKSVRQAGITDTAIVSNTRHYDALSHALEAINSIHEGLNTGLTPDLLSVDIHKALYHLGEITGEITTDEILGNIFSKFCIGK